VDPNLPRWWTQTILASKSNSTTAASITAAIASASVAAAAASRAAAAPFSLHRRWWRWTARDHVCRPTADGTHPLIRTISATFGLQVACRHHSDPRWLLAPHGTADDAVEAALKWAAVPVAKRKSATVAQAPSPWQPPYSLLSPRGAPSQLPAPSHDSSRGRASATAPETRPWSRSETFTPPPPLGPLFAGCRAKLQCRADRAEFCSFAETTDQTCQNERPPTLTQ
jgi:hypothetical protein